MEFVRRGPIAGTIVVVLLFLNTCAVSVPFYAVAFAKFVAPVRRWRRFTTGVLERLATGWSRVNDVIFHVFHRIRWDLHLPEGLDLKSGYLVIANHQSWVDVLALQRVLRGRIPFPKFFIKRELIFLPLLGLAWWALDYPFMRRYGKHEIEARPERRTHDADTTQRVLARARGVPSAILNFVEGTRFTLAKHREQGSPFRHLLKPKAGGVAYAITALGDQLRHTLDVTIFYPGSRLSFWDFVCGRVRRVVVKVRSLPVPRELAEAYTRSAEGRERFRAWLENLWAEKDRELAQLHAAEQS